MNFFETIKNTFWLIIIFVLFFVLGFCASAIMFKSVENNSCKEIKYSKLINNDEYKSGDFYCEINRYKFLNNSDFISCHQIIKFIKINNDLYVSVGNNSEELKKVKDDFFILRNLNK